MAERPEGTSDNANSQRRRPRASNLAHAALLAGATVAEATRAAATRGSRGLAELAYRHGADPEDVCELAGIPGALEDWLAGAFVGTLDHAKHATGAEKEAAEAAALTIARDFVTIAAPRRRSAAAGSFRNAAALPEPELTRPATAGGMLRSPYCRAGCGKPVATSAAGRPREFCSNACRQLDYRHRVQRAA